MYRINVASGTVTRISDNKVVAPASNTDDPDYLAYCQWANGGGVPVDDGFVSRVVPNTATPKNIRLALTRMGLRQNIEEFVAASDQDVKDTWEKAIEIRIDDPLIQALPMIIGVPWTTVEDAFILASSLGG